MNNTRRKQIRKHVISVLESARQDLDIVIGEEQEAFDNIPEGLQESDRGAEMEESIAEMEDIVGELEDLQGRLEEVIER